MLTGPERTMDREAVCRECPEYLGLCKLVFPAVVGGGCGDRTARARLGWQVWLDEPESECPLGHWNVANKTRPSRPLGGHTGAATKMATNGVRSGNEG